MAFSASVKKPVDSTTIWAPTEAQSSLAGSRSAKTLICLAVDGDEVGAVGDLVLEVAEDGVVLEQVGQGGGGGEVVDGDEFDVRVAEGAAEDVASDAAEAVDAYLYCHISLLLVCDVVDALRLDCRTVDRNACISGNY